MPRDSAYEDDRPRRFDDDDDDDRPRRIRRDHDVGIDAVIPFRNGMALASYYCGVFGLIGCFLLGVGGIFGIVPIVFGVLGLVRASRDPEARGRVHAWVGIALGALEVLTACGVVGLFIYGILNDPHRR